MAVNNLFVYRFATLALLAAIAIGVPYKVCTDCELINAYEWKPLVFATVLGGLVTLLFYKTFLENEPSLNRRLNRVKAQKLQGHDPKRPVRIWVDGCFDMMHFGHANAFRQARALGDVLVVGVNSDRDIIKYKGPPTMNQDERTVAVRACKWVDEVVEDVPYVLNQEYLDYLFKELKIDYIVHGDDPCLLPDGSDVFATAKAAGRFKTIKRTEGVSTTDIVGRMLLNSREHHHRNPDVSDAASDTMHGDNETQTISNSASRSSTALVPTGPMDVADASHTSFVRGSTFMPTTRRFNQFSNNRPPRPEDVIVYVDGTWDMFHAGHIEFLEQCRKLGTYLIVGIYTDDVANRALGSNYPIMNLHERALSVLSCRHVDDVIFGAPWKITRDLIVTFNISVVCAGEVRDSKTRAIPVGFEDPYEVPTSMNIMKFMPSPRPLTTQDIVDRILAQKLAFEEKFRRKNASEQKYNAEKEYVAEL